MYDFELTYAFVVDGLLMDNMCTWFLNTSVIGTEGVFYTNAIAYCRSCDYTKENKREQQVAYKLCRSLTYHYGYYRTVVITMIKTQQFRYVYKVIFLT